MNKSDIAEIKKLLTIKNTRIGRIVGCYVDIDKNIRVLTNKTFQTLEEEERHKYLELLKSGLSGRIGKNQLDLDFTSEEKQNEMLALLHTELKEDSPEITEFFRKIVALFDYVDNYYILLTHTAYDIPSKGTDHMSQGESDYVYSYLSCEICPAKPSKAGLTYDSVANVIVNAEQNMMIEKPILGFVYPAFTDRSMDIHHLLYFTKKSSEVDEAIIDGILGARLPITADNQNDIFVETLEETLGESLDFQTAKAICETIHETEVEKKEQEAADEPFVLDQVESKSLLAKSGVEPEKVAVFEEKLEQAVSKAPIHAENVLGGSKKLNINTGKANISMDIEDSNYVDVRTIDGRKCLVIELTESVTVNGMTVKEALLEE